MFQLSPQEKGQTLTVLGRKEIITFFYIYMALTIISLVVDAGVVPPRSGPFPYFVAGQNGLASALCTCLLINGFVGFQLYEDGTALSVWLLRLTSTGMFVISFVVSLLTFKSWGGLSPTNTIGMFVVLYVLNAICIAVYIIMQLILAFNTLEDRWPLGHIAFGVLVFVIGQVLLYAFSDTICDKVQHYLDGLFFATFCNLLTVMMVYKVCPTCPQPRNWITDRSHLSSGIILPRKTSNSRLASSQITGKSRSFCRMTNGAHLYTRTRNTPAACTASELRAMVRNINFAVFFSLFGLRRLKYIFPFDKSMTLKRVPCHILMLSHRALCVMNESI